MQFFSLSKNVLSGLFQIHSTAQPIPTNGVGSIAVISIPVQNEVMWGRFLFLSKETALRSRRV